MRSPEMKRRRPGRGSAGDLEWALSTGFSAYGRTRFPATLPPLVDLHLGSNFLRGFAAGRSM